MGPQTNAHPPPLLSSLAVTSVPSGKPLGPVPGTEPPKVVQAKALRQPAPPVGVPRCVARRRAGSPGAGCSAVRPGSAVMREISRKMTDDEAKAVAAYLQSAQPAR